MRQMLTICILLGLFNGNAPLPPEDLATGAFETLTEATRTGDPAAYPTLELVLRDMAEQSYLYPLGVRQAAFDYLSETGDRRALALLRRTALIEIDYDGDKVTLDRIAIRGALAALAELGSEDAAQLSLRRLPGDDWLQTAALITLGRLEHWEATPPVEELLCSLPRDDDHHGVIFEAAEFLRKSPLVTAAICPCIDDVWRAYEKRFEHPESYTDKVLDKTLELLDARLDCAALAAAR